GNALLVQRLQLRQQGVLNRHGSQAFAGFVQNNNGGLRQQRTGQCQQLSFATAQGGAGGLAAFVQTRHGFVDTVQRPTIIRARTSCQPGQTQAFLHGQRWETAPALWYQSHAQQGDFVRGP